MAYVQEALGFIQETFYKTDEVDWEPIRDWAFDIVEENPSTEGAHEAVELVFRVLATPHNGFTRPDDNQDAPRPEREPPSGERLEGDIGFLSLPGIVETEKAPEYALKVREIMENLDAADPVCGWILDLRESAGGSSAGDWLGLGPLVSDDLLMHFGKSDGTKQSVYYDDGIIRYEDDDLSEGEVEVPERVPSDAYVPESLDVPIAVLISRRTASAGEAIAITFAGRPDNRFFGEQTRGATTSSEFHEMPDGAVLRVAGGFYQDRTGHEYELGLQPDTPVRAIPGRQGHILKAAVEWLEGTESCQGSAG